MGMIDDDFMIIVTDSHDFVLNVFRKKDLHRDLVIKTDAGGGSESRISKNPSFGICITYGLVQNSIFRRIPPVVFESKNFSIVTLRGRKSA